MGTNFYLSTKDKDVRDKYFGYNYELTDNPDWGYEIHIAKTSCGWLPSFQAHNCFNSIRELKRLYETGLFVLYDEYGQIYNWKEFDERVLQFNGGVKGAIPTTKYEQDRTDNRFYDADMPDELPVSHFDYGKGKYAYRYFKDEDGYEFTRDEFS